MDGAATIDSASVGDPERFLDAAALEQRLLALPAAPVDDGEVVLIVSRHDGGVRRTPIQVLLTAAGGVPGDAWARRTVPDPEMQIAVMQAGVAHMVANGQPLLLFGDNLFLDLDLSADRLPPGSRLRLGQATVQVTPMPHNGCRKFRARFGGEALRFVNEPAWRARNLRGIYMRVIEDGVVARGDRARVLWRAPAV